MVVPGVLSASFIYDHPNHKDLPKVVKTDSTVPCRDTLNRFILSVDRGERKVTASISLEQMIKCDLSKDSTKEAIQKELKYQKKWWKER